MKKIITLLLVLACTQLANASSINYWTTISAAQAETFGEQVIKVNACKYYELNIAALSGYLQNAPMERSNKTPLILELPMPDGTTQAFAMVESPVMELGLQLKYPSIKTYAGQSLNNPTATIRIDITESGFHAMVLASDESVFIDPINFSTNQAYMVYNKSDAINTHPHICNVVGTDDAMNNLIPVSQARNSNNPNNSVLRNAGDTLRTYRLALACTGEYANYFPGTPTKLSTLGHMVTSVNRVVGVYEKELSIHMNLIANDDTLINLNGATDPYDDADGSAMLGQNQTTVNIRVGPSNYDIGHVFSTGGGGIAGLGVVCNIGQKARGVTGSPAPVGDPFDIDYVAHEMGHQFGANHPFNGTTLNCGGGNRNNSTAYESGSGSTIMAYAGICSLGSVIDDIQLHSDAYFHTISFDEIRNYTTYTGATGGTCPVKTLTGNHPPIITSIGLSAYTIPLSTPFVLTGAANDPDLDPITYCWEEFDLGPACLANSPTGNSPSFRSLNPSTSPSRTFPRQTVINANYPLVFPSPYRTAEVLPSYARTMKFRLTARDNRSGGGGVTYDPSFVTLTVNGSAGPFLVTVPNTNVTWAGATMQNITWNVANTDLSPISVSTVNILLSIDGGLTYPYTLATGVANNGLASVQLPNVTSTTARIKVESVGNIFFDISNVNFTITAVIGLNENSLSFETVTIYPNPSTGEFNISWAGKYNGTIDLKVYDVQGRVVFAQKIIKQNNGFIHTINLDQVAKGVYTLEANTTEGRIIQKLIVQ